jgi:hypothetical protein
MEPDDSCLTSFPERLKIPSEMDDSTLAAFLAAADTVFFQGISSRVAFLQSRLLQQARTIELGAGMETSNAESSHHSRRRSARQGLTTLLGRKMSQYGQYTVLYNPSPTPKMKLC